ncbi:hypothetical protein U1Q18_016717 [Sarracenia purpurea var. burkii]
MKKLRDKISGPITPALRLGKSGVDPLSHVGYSELGIYSDTESEFLKLLLFIKVQLFAHTDNLAPVKQTQQTSDPGPSVLDQCIQIHVSEPRDVKCLASDDVIGHGLGELNWEQANPKPYPSALLELISLDDVPPPSNVLDVPVGLLENKPSGPLPQGSGLFLLSELIIPNDASPFSKTMEIPVKVSPKNSVDVIGTRDIGHTFVIKHEEVPRWISTTVADFKTDRTLTDTAPSISNEQKFLVLQKSPSLEGNYTGYESLDGISVGEIEGESIVDRLKRHDEYDRRCMSSLYKELEEERNVSEVTANQAMG